MGIITGNIDAAREHISIRYSKESVAVWSDRLTLFLSLLLSILLLPALTVDFAVRSVSKPPETNRSRAPPSRVSIPRGSSASIVQGRAPQPGDSTLPCPTWSPERVRALVVLAAIMWAGGRLREFGQAYAPEITVDVSRAYFDIISTNTPIPSPPLYFVIQSLALTSISSS